MSGLPIFWRYKWIADILRNSSIDRNFQPFFYQTVSCEIEVFQTQVLAEEY